ncbi:MAG: FG-GAP repeat domain-containing protein, partial [Planctomycetota bacterium]
MYPFTQGLLIAILLLLPGQVAGEAAGDTRSLAWNAAQRPAAVGGLQPPQSDSGAIAPAAVGRARPRAKLRHGSFEFPEARTLDVTYRGPAALVQQMKSNLAVGTALASADFDGDGTPDLVAGYSGPAGPAVAVHTGNPDAIFPHSPDAMARKAAGTFTDAPFLNRARLFPAEVAPEFLEAGDFDGDGHQDVVVARRGATELHLLAGDGQGGLAVARTVALPGAVTALASGEINLRDLRPDLAVGVVNDDGAAVLVFAARPGALAGPPERFDLQAPSTGLAFGRLDEGVFFDLAVAAGSDVVLISGRDRRLAVRQDARGHVAPAEVTTIASLDSPIRAVATGDYRWNAEVGWRNELALLTADGALHVLGRDTAGGWSAIGRRDVSSQAATSGDLLVTARVSGVPMEEVIVLDRAGKRLEAVLGQVHLEGQDPAAGRLEAPLVGSLEREPIAALPMRLDRNNLSDLVLLQDGLSAPAVAASVAAIITVVDPAPDLGPVPNGLCSLSEAIDNANANAPLWLDCAAGTGPGDLIDFAIGAGGFPVTIPVGFIAGAVTQVGTHTMTDGDTIDGFSQGCAFGPCIGLDGTPLGAPASGLNLYSSGNVVRGMALHGFLGGGRPRDRSQRFRLGKHRGGEL